MESRVRDEITEHPELGDLDDSSRNGGSTAPTTSNGTPAPAMKLKLTFNSNSHFTNGGSSGQQSDDDE
jgi:ATP-dependent helicase STH1/SNF2